MVTILPINVIVDALTICNSCDSRPMVPDNPAGYCQECLNEVLKDMDKDTSGFVREVV